LTFLHNNYKIQFYLWFIPSEVTIRAKKLGYLYVVFHPHGCTVQLFPMPINLWANEADFEWPIHEEIRTTSKDWAVIMYNYKILTYSEMALQCKIYNYSRLSTSFLGYHGLYCVVQFLWNCLKNPIKFATL
jgi:hypothetical protein